MVPGDLAGCRQSLGVAEGGRGSFQRGSLGMVAEALGALRIMSGRFDRQARLATTDALVLSLVGNQNFDTLEDSVGRGVWDGRLIHPVSIFLMSCEARLLGGEVFERCRRVCWALERAKVYDLLRSLGAPWCSAVRSVCSGAPAREIAKALEGTPFAASFMELGPPDRLDVRLTGIINLAKSRRAFGDLARPFSWAWCADLSLGAELLGIEDEGSSALMNAMPVVIQGVMPSEEDEARVARIVLRDLDGELSRLLPAAPIGPLRPL